MDLFESYDSELESVLSSIASKLSSDAREQRGDVRKALFGRIERELEEADEIVAQMEIEVRTATFDRQRLQAKLQESKTVLSKHKADLRSLIAASERESLLSTKSMPHTAVEFEVDDAGQRREQSQRLLSITDQLSEGQRRLNESHRIALETEITGSGILASLREQREGLQHTVDRLYEADGAIDRASGTLRKMFTSLYQQKIVTYSIIGCLVFLIKRKGSEDEEDSGSGDNMSDDDGGGHGGGALMGEVLSNSGGDKGSTYRKRHKKVFLGATVSCVVADIAAAIWIACFHFTIPVYVWAVALTCSILEALFIGLAVYLVEKSKAKLTHFDMGHVQILLWAGGVVIDVSYAVGAVNSGTGGISGLGYQQIGAIVTTFLRTVTGLLVAIMAWRHGILLVQSGSGSSSSGHGRGSQTSPKQQGSEGDDDQASSTDESRSGAHSPKELGTRSQRSRRSIRSKRTSRSRRSSKSRKGY